MTWQQKAVAAIVDMEGAGAYIAKGLAFLRDNPEAAKLIRAEPILAGVAERLIGMIPIIGQAESILSLVEFGAEDWDAIAAIGAVVHFHSATPEEMEKLRPSFNSL